MINEISIDRWVKAQESERTYHTKEFLKSAKHYEVSYEHYFRYTGVSKNLQGKSIIEIGPAKVAGLYFCKNYGKSYIIEPTVYQDAIPFYDPEITFIHEAAETCDFPKVDEAWLFNVLEHTINPTKIVEICKKNCDTIRFFEPDGQGGKDIAHPHCITMDYLKLQFGEENVHQYIGGSVKENFHGANCCYGVWNKNKL